MTRPSIGIIMTIAAIAAMVLFSCGKENPAPVPTPPISDSCEACDNLKKLLLNDPELVDGKKYLDSLQCDKDNVFCNIIDRSKIVPNEPYKEMYDLNFKIINKWLLLYGYLSYIPSKYKYVYYCFDATSDTPYMAPMYLAMDFDEARPNGRGIRCKFDEFSEYFDPTFIYRDGNGVEQKGFYKNNKYDNMPLYQVKDTLIMNKMDKKISINGVIGTYWVVHNFVMSSDMETLGLTAQVYDRSPGRSDAKLLKTITSYTLKRLKY